jgi:hypothetical protein
LSEIKKNNGNAAANATASVFRHIHQKFGAHRQNSIINLVDAGICWSNFDEVKLQPRTVPLF